MVSSLVLSRIDYCNSLYYGLPDTSLNPLYKVCCTFRTPRFSPTSRSLVFLHWLLLKYRMIFKICLIMFKIKKNLEYLTNSIRVPNRSGLRSLSFNHNSVYRVKHSYAKRSFSYSGPFLWNSLPSSLILTKSLTLFQKGLKTHLFGKFFTKRFWSPRKRSYKKLNWLVDLHFYLFLSNLEPSRYIWAVSALYLSYYGI